MIWVHTATAKVANDNTPEDQAAEMAIADTTLTLH
jgi:hypothetical protein